MQERVPRYHSLLYILYKDDKTQGLSSQVRILPARYIVILMDAILLKDKTYSLFILIVSIIYKSIYSFLHFNVFRLIFKYC